MKQLSADVTWVTNLGNAFLQQQDDVMNAVVPGDACESAASGEIG